MRFRKGRIASLAALSLSALVWSGCEAKQQSEYVAGVSTQVRVPRDLQYIRISISQGGVPRLCRAYPVYNGRVQLPRSLGSFAEREPGSDPITFTIVGYTEKLDETEALEDFCSTNASVGGKLIVGENGARILRRVRQPYVKDEILFLPMPLKYACYDTAGCTDDQTCKAGKCVSADVPNPAEIYPKFTPELVDGTGGDCFSTQFCLGAALPAIPVDLATCTYAIPNTASAPPTQNGLPNPFALPPGSPPVGDGINVEITYDGGYVREVLDKDPDEGFTIPDPAKPQQFRLAAGLCDMVKGNVDDPTKRITAVRASPTCRPKSLSQPICQTDSFTQMGLDPQGASSDPPELAGCSATELKPPRTGLMVVMDNTKEHASFYNEAVNVDLALLALQDPAFYRADIGVVYASGAAACGATSMSGVGLESAISVVPKIKTSLEAEKVAMSSKTEGTEVPRFDSALDRAYQQLEADPAKYFRRAIILIGERDFAGTQCVANAATDSATARAAAHKDKTLTYVFDLAGNTNDPFPPEADALAAAGGTAPAYDARGSSKANAKEGFQQVVERLATCIYDAPKDATKLPDGGTLSYNDAAIPSVVFNIKNEPSCTDGTQNVNGWGKGSDGKIYICGQACTDYRTRLKNAALLTLPFGQPPPAMPVFGHKPNCAPKGS